MSIICACDTGALSMGLPSCQVVPGEIKKLIFTTDLEPRRIAAGTGANSRIFVAFSGPNNQPAWYYEITSNAIPAGILSNFEQFLYFRDTYKLQTHVLDAVESERGDPVTEEVGGLPFFVRTGDRTVTATTVAKTSEFGRFIDQLRCQSKLGVFFVDKAGIVWGMRSPWSFNPANTPFALPIPVIPSTINSRQILPSSSTVQKIVFSFTLGRDFDDFEFVPLQRDEVLVQYSHSTASRYNSPVHLIGIAQDDGTNLSLKMYYEISTAAGQTIGLLDAATLGNYLPSVYDASGAVLTGPAAWTYAGNGVWTQASVAGAAYIAYSTALLNTVPPLNFDFYSFRVNL